MKTITRIAGVDNKIGRNSRTGSTISITVPDENILDVTQYFLDFKAGNEPDGKIKKIELVIYEDQESVDLVENLKAEIKELKECLENIDKVVENADKLDEVMGDSESQVYFNRLKCDNCGNPFEWKNVIWTNDLKEITHQCSCACITNETERLKHLVEKWNKIEDDKIKMRDFIVSDLGESWVDSEEKPVIVTNKDFGIPEDENLPPNQSDLDIYDKKCECGSSAFVNGRCANCGGVE